MPPLHPPSVHFPIALAALSVFADVLGYWKNNASLHGAGWWALAAACAGGVLAAMTGIFDSYRPSIGPSILPYVRVHMYVGLSLVPVLSGLTYWRWRIFSERSAMNRRYLFIAVCAVALVLFQGWLGGELVYSYGAG